MILQALYEYYQRKAADPESNIAPQGWGWKEIPFSLVLNSKGEFIEFRDKRQPEGKKLIAQKFLVPSLGEQKGSGIKANLLWENAEYMLGFPLKTGNEKYYKRVEQQFDSFKQKTLSLKVENEKHKGLLSIINFLSSIPTKALQKNSLWSEIIESNANIIFEIDGTGIITDDIDIKQRINNREKSKPDGYCLVSGTFSKISRLHPPVVGVKGANPTGSGIVAVNNEIVNGANKGQTPAFASYMKQQGFNSSISEEVAFAYTTALNHLLRKNSDNNSKTNIGDMTIVFWQKKSDDSPFDIENNFKWYFDDSPKDDPDKGVRAVQALYSSVYSGKQPIQNSDIFYVLGVSPNSARISIRIWSVKNIYDLSAVIKQHYDDMDIKLCLKQTGMFDKWDYENKLLESAQYLTLSQILQAVVLKYDKEKIPPNLAGQFVRSILDGTPYPEVLMNLCINRIRAERHVTRARAAILKAHINRYNRFYNKNEKEVAMGLDRTNVNIGYRLGRLFSVIEKIDEEGGSGKIRERFYSAASSNPSTVLSRLMTLKNHHLAKLENVGRKVNFEKEIMEIVSEITEFPAHLSLKEQSYFAIGYYHQRMEYFTPKPKPDNKKEGE